MRTAPCGALCSPLCQIWHSPRALPECWVDAVCTASPTLGQVGGGCGTSSLPGLLVPVGPMQRYLMAAGHACLRHPLQRPLSEQGTPADVSQQGERGHGDANAALIPSLFPPAKEWMPSGKWHPATLRFSVFLPDEPDSVLCLHACTKVTFADKGEDLQNKPRLW